MKLRNAIAGVLLAASIVAGCGNAADIPLRVGLLVWPAYELPYLARHLGYYDDHDVQLVEFHSPAEALRAYRSRGIDAVAVTIDYLIQLNAKHPQHRAVMAINISNGADAVLARPGIEATRDLRGHRIGVERSALGAYMLARMLEHAGMTRGDVEIISVDVSDSPSAFQEGRVDAVITYEPYRTRILEAGAVELFSSREIPGEIVDVLVTRTELMESHAEPLQALVDGWLRAVDYLDKQPRAAAEVLARREGLTPVQYLRALEGIELVGRARNRRLLAGPEPALMESLRRTEQVMRQESLVRDPAAVEQLLDARFLRPDS